MEVFSDFHVGDETGLLNIAYVLTIALDRKSRHCAPFRLLQNVPSKQKPEWSAAQ